MSLILPLERLLLHSTLFEEELPYTDSNFSISDNLKLFICFRPLLKYFLEECAKLFEVIVWSSNQYEYTKKLVAHVEQELNFKFDHCLCLSE